MKLAPAPEPTALQQRQNSLDLLAPAFRQQVEEILRLMRQGGFDPIVWETLRTNERQAYLYGFGRDYDDVGDPRGIVTNAATAFLSYHGFGWAVDIISASKFWGPKPQFWSALGDAALRVGCVWGGTWRRADLPHVQYAGTVDVPLPTTAPSEALRKLLATEGREAVWRMAQADRPLVFPVRRNSQTGLVRPMVRRGA